MPTSPKTRDYAKELAGLLVEAAKVPHSDLVRALDVVIARSGWPHFASKMLLRAVVRELSGMRGTSPGLPGGVGQERLRDTMARFEARVLRRALEHHGQRHIATARSLAITRECPYK